MALFSRLIGHFSGHITKLEGPYSFSTPVSINLNFVGLRIYHILLPKYSSSQCGVDELHQRCCWCHRSH
jgi:hypothetical protein